MATTLTSDQLGNVLSALPSAPRIVVSGNMATPAAALAVIDSWLPEATIHMLNAVRELPQRPGLTFETTFVGSAMRHAETLRYVPCRLSTVPHLFRRFLQPDVVMLHVSTPQGGRVSLGIEVNVLPAAVDAARANGGKIVAFVNPAMPYTYGDSEISLGEIDYLVEIDEPLLSVQSQQVPDVALAIGERVSEHIHHGSTLQLGIGDIPNAVLASVQASSLRIWTETFSDGVMQLERAGQLDREVPLRTSFLVGSAELYDWANRNPRLHMIRTEVCNDPAQIARHDGMISINAALQVDLYGQSNAGHLNGKIYSGFGGSTDFIVGAMRAPGGHAFMTLPSWHHKSHSSTIVDRLTEPVTSFQQHAVVTEQGIAWLFGVEERQQAHNLITEAAHPDARDELLERAHAIWG